MRHPADYTTCNCGKRGYHHKTDAKRVRRTIGDKHLGIYRCPHSNYWHLGHKPRLLIRGRISRSQIAADQEDRSNVRSVGSHDKGGELR